MILCEQCPANPACSTCLDQLCAGESAHKVIPPRRIRLTHLSTGHRLLGELRVVSRRAIGVGTEHEVMAGQYEIVLASDFRIMGNAVPGIGGACYTVFDIEKVYRQEEITDRLVMETIQSWLICGDREPDAMLARLKKRDEERERLIKQELRKLSILRQIKEIFLYVWEEGEVRPLGQFRAEPPAEEQLKAAALRAVAAGVDMREQIVVDDGQQVYDLFASPLPDTTCGLALINITGAITAERERKQKEWMLYKQVLSAVTQGKLQLLQEAELAALVRDGETVLATAVRSAEELAAMRNAIRQKLQTAGMTEKALHPFLVAVNEAATNTVKHGTGGMVTLCLFPREKLCRVIVADQGQGILLEDLPRMALQQGYSTCHSLGAGFSLMLQLCDRLSICSSEAGTQLILEKSSSK